MHPVIVIESGEEDFMEEVDRLYDEQPTLEDAKEAVRDLGYSIIESEGACETTDTWEPNVMVHLVAVEPEIDIPDLG